MERKGLMKVKKIIGEVNELQESIDDIEVTLHRLRGVDWRIGVEHDERFSVVTLYNQYTKLQSRLDALMNTDIEVIDDPLAPL